MTTTPIRQPATIAGRPGVPFGRLLHAELRKLTDTRAGRWLLISIIAITMLVVAVTLIVAPARYLTYDKFVDFTQTPQKILLPVLGILAVTSEWSQRTGLVTFTLAPNRGTVLWAKCAATLLLGAASVATAFAGAAVGNLLGMALRHGNGSWAFGATGFRDLLLVQVTGLLQGLAFGMLLLVSAAAIVMYYVVPNLWDLLFSALPALKNAAPWLDLNAAQRPLYLHQMTGAGWAHLATAVAIWVGVPLVAGVVRVRRSEVKSG